MIVLAPLIAINWSTPNLCLDIINPAVETMTTIISAGPWRGTSSCERLPDSRTAPADPCPPRVRTSCFRSMLIVFRLRSPVVLAGEAFLPRRWRYGAQVTLARRRVGGGAHRGHRGGQVDSQVGSRRGAGGR